MKPIFLAAGPIEWASSRMRCYWPAEHIPGARVYSPEEFNTAINENPNPDAVIFQKIVIPSIAKDLQAHNVPVYWDVCDPAWWWEPQRCREIIQYVNGVVCSNDGLREDFDEWSERAVPSFTIADRLELSHFPKQREHGHADPVRLVWFGLSANRAALQGAVPVLERLAANGYHIELTIFDDAPEQVVSSDVIAVYHVRWSLHAENSLLSAHDVALLPPYPGAWGAVKSNNKHLTAWASGLPVADGLSYYQLEALVKYPLVRANAAMAGLCRVRTEYTADLSAREWMGILCAS